MLLVADKEVEENSRRRQKKKTTANRVRDERFRHDSTGAEITAPVQTDVCTTASCQRLNTLALLREATNTQMGFSVSNLGCLTAEQPNLTRQSADTVNSAVASHISQQNF